MTRYIDADALTDDILKSAVMIDDTGIQTGYEIAIELIKRQPTIDAEPVKRGKWIWNDKCRRVCSVCENPVAFMLSKDGWHEGRYCPNCGADMRGERMSDLISRQAAIDASEKFIKDCNPEHFVGHQKFIEYMDNAEIGSFGKWQFANGFNMGLTAAEVAIKKLPSAQPTAEPVRHGKWVFESIRRRGVMTCSECRKMQDYQTLCFTYCPNCGARMDGK